MKYIGKNILNHTLNVKKGNVSGSSTSTGSFGSLVVTDKIQGNITVGGAVKSGLTINQSGGARGLIVHAEDSSHSYMQISNTTTGTTTGDGLQFGILSDESGFIAQQENNFLRFDTNATERFRITADGDITFSGANQEISGSSTSTGSFGKLQVGTATIQIPSLGFITMGSEEGMVKNTRFGASAGANLQSGGTQHVLIGESAGAALTTGDKNVAMGVEALTAATGDSLNVAIGYRALKALNTNGIGGNTAVGVQAGDGLTTGTLNTLIGYFTEASANSGTNQIVIGNEVTGLGDNQTVIGNSSQTHVVFGGDALISGSAQSTGSFGKLKILNTELISHGGASGYLTIGAVGTGNAANKKLNVSGEIGANSGDGFFADGIGFANSDGSSNINLGDWDGEGATLNLYGHGVVGAKIISSGHVEFPVANQKISGSSTSTGSFGDGRFTSKVGIGLGITTALSTPHSYLDVRGDNVTPSNGNGSYHTMQLVDTSTSAEGVGGGIAFGGKFVGNTDTLFGEIRGLKENGTSNNYAGALTFQTRAHGANLIEQVRIDSSGNLEAVRGNISGSSTSTGSFGRVEADVFSGSFHGQIGARYIHTQSTPSTTWTINHALGTKYPNVTVYDTNDQMIIPTTVTANGGSNMTLTFSAPVTGVAMVGIGGGSSVNGRTFMFNQDSTSTLWQVTHSLGEQYPAVTIYDEADNVIIPQRIYAKNTSEAEIYFQNPTSGNAHFSIGNGLPGINSDNAGNFMRVSSGGTHIEYTTSTADVTGSFDISGSITLTGEGSVSSSVTSTGSFGSIHTAGDIGIGTTAPATTLHIVGGVGSPGDGIRIERSGFSSNYITIDSDSINTNSGELRLQNDSGGDVIIGGSISGSAISTGSFGVLTIGETGGTGNAQAGAQSLVAENGITIYNTGTGRLNFSDGAGGGDSAYKGVIKYNHSTNILTFAANAVDRVSLNPSGVLQTLHVSGSSTSTGSFGAGFFGGNVGVGINPDITGFDRILHVGGTSTAIVRFTGTTYSNDGGYVGLNYGGMELWQKRNAYMRFGTNNTERLRITDDGAVGIGTSSPATNLHISASSGNSAIFRISNDENKKVDITASDGNSAFIEVDDTFPINIGHASSTKLFIDTHANSGNVGIGTSSPTRKLHVEGDAIVTGILTAQEFHTEFVSASVMFDSGSTIFGDTQDDIHHFTGSLRQSGSTQDHYFLTGNVGIGTTSPNELLTLQSSVAGADDIFLIKADDGGNVFRVGKDASDDGYIEMFDGSGNKDVQIHTGAVTYFNGGNVGINQASPDSLLHIVNPDSGTYRFGYSGTSDVYIDSDNVYLRSDNGNVNYVTFKGDGSNVKVGIGTTVPSQKLEVSAGNIMISGSGGAGLIFKGTTDGSNKNALYFKNASNTEKFRIIHDPSANGTDDLQFKANANSVTVMTMLQNGNVGIGITTPMASSDGIAGLEIGGSAAPGLTIKSTSSSQIYSLWADASGNINIQDNTNNVTRLSISSGGNVTFPSANTKISGSSTSTGSFGQSIIGSTTNLDVSSDLFVKNDAVGATATFVGDGSGDTSKIRLGTSWGRHWSFIASPYDTYAPGNAYDLEIGYTLDNAAGDYNELSGSIVFNNYKNVAFMGSGSVGIGTRTPAYALDVVNNQAGHSEIRAKATDGTNRARLRLDANAQIAEIYFANNGTNKTAIYANGGGDDSLNFWTFASGIGTTATMEQDTGDWNFHYNVSGASTSTASFADGKFADFLHVGKGNRNPGNPHLLSLSASAAGTDFLVATQHDGGQAFRMSMDSGGDAAFEIGSAGTSDMVVLASDGTSYFKGGDVEFTKANAKISGSSTSTGSFGRVEIADGGKVMVGGINETITGVNIQPNTHGYLFNLHPDGGTTTANKRQFSFYIANQSLFINPRNDSNANQGSIIEFNHDGDITFDHENRGAQLSGSAVSSGSFGKINAADHLSVGFHKQPTFGADSAVFPLHVLQTDGADTAGLLVQTNNAGDAGIMFNISGQSFIMGIDNSATGDPFVIADSNDLSTTARMSIASDGVISGDFNDTSDIALKENIFEISSSYEKVKQLNPVTFNWKEEEEKGTDEQIGFIAQEVEKVYPQLVEGEEGNKSVNVVGLVSVLTKTVQELTQKVEELEDKLK